MKTLLIGLLAFAPTLSHAKIFRCSYDYNRMQAPGAIRFGFDIIVSNNDLMMIAPSVSNSNTNIQARRGTKPSTFEVARRDTGKLLVGTALFLRSIVLHYENSDLTTELQFDLGTGSKTYSNFYDCVKN